MANKNINIYFIIIITGIIVILISLILFKENYQLKVTIKKLQSEENTFKQNEYCREKYSKKLDEKLQNKYFNTNNLKEFWSIKDIFFSVSKNECFAAYEVHTFLNNEQQPTIYNIQQVPSDNLFSTTDSYSEYIKDIDVLKTTLIK